MDTIDPKLDERAAAAHTGLAPSSLATLRCRGSGPPYYKLGRRVVYSRRDLDEWLEKRRVGSTAAVAAGGDASTSNDGGA